MTRPVGLVIFDCDRVLVDSERLAVRVSVAVLAALDWPLSEAEVAPTGSPGRAPSSSRTCARCPGC